MFFKQGLGHQSIVAIYQGICSRSSHRSTRMQAGPVQDNTAIQQWHFNILAVKVYDEDAIVTAAYKAEVLQAHPDRNHTCVNAVVKTQMLNEAKSLLLDKQKRENFERKCLSGVTNSNVDKGDIVMIHSLATKKYNLTYGRVVSVNLGNVFEKKFTVKTQHSCVQYDTTHVDDSAIINVSCSMIKQRLSRVYGEPERNAADKQWSEHYVKNDSVIIKNVEEAPWYNNMEATIVGYNHDLMRFNVVLGGRELAFMPHNIFLSKVSLEDAEAKLKEAERTLTAKRWSMYWKKDDRVMINNVHFKYDGMEATIVGYNHDMMSFDVLLDGQELAFMPQNIFSPNVVRHAASVGEGAARTAYRAKSHTAPSAVEYSVGQSVEVLWRNDCGGDAGKARKITWHVGMISAIHHEGSVVASYDVEMPQSFVKQPRAIIFNVKPKEIQPKRKRGKRERAPQ